MNAILRFVRSFKRYYKILLLLIIFVVALQGFGFGLPAGKTNLSGNLIPAAAASDPVIAAAGDIACDPATTSFNGGLGTSSSCREQYTSNLLVNGGFTAILSLGDNQYNCGGYQAFLQSYDPSWGRVKSITYPVVGNHEYLTSGGTGCDSTNTGAAGYYQYFGSAAGTVGQGYYSFNIGAWHLIALNSSCSQVGGCGSTSPQYKWLQADLAANPNQCTLAYWHIPLFSSGGRASASTRPFWTLLYNAHADIVLNGHDHIYERFAPQTSTGALDQANGVREFVVGTGGADHTSIASVAANSEVRNATTFGVLELTLHPASYDWQFVPETGQTFTDAGTQTCHSSPPNTPTTTGSPAASGTPSATPTGTLVTDTPTYTLTATPTLTPTSTFTPTATSAGGSMTFTPVADTYVNAGSTGSNYGSSTTLRLDGSPDEHAYLRFTVAGLSGTITQVRLLLYANNSDSSGIRAWGVADNSWGELTTNYSNAPALGSQLATSGSFASGAWVSLDVTAYVNGNGTFSFGVTNLSSTAISVASRESGANATQLIVTYSSALTSTSTPTLTSTPTTTQAASNTPTFTLTPSPTFTYTPTLTSPPTFTPTATSAGGSVTFTPVADTYVNASSPSTNYGSAGTLRLDGSPDEHAYLRFTVTGLSGTITQVSLLLHTNTSDSKGIAAWAVADNSWGELTTNYGNAPALGSQLAATGAFASGVWVSLDVTAFVSGNGTYSFGVTNLNSTAISVGSREASGAAPQLVITYH